MILYYASLASGSNGNCYYIGNNQEAVLIDAGISCKETESRMAQLGLSMQAVKAIFISHEHTDHTSGAPVLSKKYNIPVYISEAAYNKSKLTLLQKNIMPLMANWPVQIGELTVETFPKLHDACDPFSFTISNGFRTVGVLTDIGSICDNVAQMFSTCDVAFLESNYDEAMLSNGQYPVFLKNRIRGTKGHLSNLQALNLVRSSAGPSLSHLILSHLSKDNNDSQKVYELFSQNTQGIRIEVASRYKETKLFGIGISGSAQVSL